MLFSKLQFKWHYHCGNVHAFLKYLTNNKREKNPEEIKYEFPTTITEKNCKNSLEGSKKIVALKTAQHDHLRKEYAIKTQRMEKNTEGGPEEKASKVFEIENKN